MTANGRRTLEVLIELEEEQPEEEFGFTASEITKRYMEKFDLPARNAPVMTVSSYLTHLKRQDLADRTQSSDKTTAWWRATDQGKEAFNEPEEG